MVSTEPIGPETECPRPGVIAITMSGKTIDGSSAETVHVSTAAPWGVASVDGVTEFEVVRETLVTW